MDSRERGVDCADPACACESTLICHAPVGVALRAAGGPLKAEPVATPGQRRSAAERSGAALILYTAGFGSASDPGQDPVLRKAPSREADGLTHLQPQHVDLRKRQMEPRPGHVSGMIRLSARLYACLRSAESYLGAGSCTAA